MRPSATPLGVILSACLLLVTGQFCIAQQFTIKRVELLNQQVIVHFDLTDDVSGRTYTLNVYGSHDNYLNPLQKLSGDFGLEVKPGLNKKFSWDPKAELGEDFSGSVALEVRGRLYIPFVRFTGFEDYRVLKRGKPYQLTWSGGTQQNILNFDLYKGDKKVTTFSNIANVGNYKLTLPTDTKPGKDYRFKISDTKNKDEVVYTGNFAVKRKTPLLLKVLPVLASGYLVVLLSGDDGKKKIPDPIKP
ncbi:MAG: hypothetical protein HRU69_13415 [Flammeovirgaceae bacterium]|nr:MAG: hypothetical protein HRU69_13415 [Flammeovirgaceae bacterium]